MECREERQKSDVRTRTQMRKLYKWFKKTEIY